MLKGINSIISPELIKVLMEMGHGDEIVFSDRNFPGNSNAKRVIRYDGCSSIPTILDAVLPLFPLDYFAEFSGVLMNPAVKQTQDPSIWRKYIEKLKNYPDGLKAILFLERLDFIERAKNAYCIVVTSESERCANLILRKGVLPA